MEPSTFTTSGYDVLRGFFEPAALSAEVDASLREAFAAGSQENSGAAGNAFRYVPMMGERTPVSLALVQRLAAVAADMLQGPVLPSRAKGTRYRGSTQWHRDSELALKSVGFAAYLEPLNEQSGALRVVPGSHRIERPDVTTSVALPTVPGDLIALDERVYHSSSGGGLRRQWRIDFVADDAGDDLLREYFSRQYPPGWVGGYDVVLYPSYGSHWRSLNARWSQRLEALGAYAHAARQEAR